MYYATSLHEHTARPLTLYSAEAIMVPHRVIWSWDTGRRWVGCYIWYSEESTGWGDWGRSPPRPLLLVLNATAHPSTASVPITLLLHNDPLLCGFNVAMKGLMKWLQTSNRSVYEYLIGFGNSFCVRVHVYVCENYVHKSSRMALLNIRVALRLLAAKQWYAETQTRFHRRKAANEIHLI